MLQTDGADEGHKGVELPHPKDQPLFEVEDLVCPSKLLRLGVNGLICNYNYFMLMQLVSYTDASSE